MTTRSSSPATPPGYPVPQPQYVYPRDDEISLVDLAKIMVRRWKTMLVIFMLVVAAALAYALSLTRTYQYVSIYNVAEQSPTSALEAPNSLVAKARNLYLGPLTRELLTEQGWTSLPFDIEVTNPSDTLLVILRTAAVTEHAEQVAYLHERVLERLRQGQSGLVERRREALERQLASTERALAALQDSTSPSAAELIATYTTRISNLEASLADLRNGEVSQVAVQSMEPSGTSRSLVLALGIVLGGMLAVIGGVFVHFAGQVRNSLQDE